MRDPSSPAPRRKEPLDPVARGFIALFLAAFGLAALVVGLSLLGTTICGTDGRNIIDLPAVGTSGRPETSPSPNRSLPAVPSWALF